MRKSKHFRKDVILARVIAAVLLLMVLALLVWGISAIVKNAKGNPNQQDSQNTEQEMEGPGTEEIGSTEDTEDEVVEDTQQETTPEPEKKVFVETTTQVRLREEPNTNCATLDRIDAGTRLEVFETLDGWYRVAYDGQEGYISATYSKIVEE